MSVENKKCEQCKNYYKSVKRSKQGLCLAKGDKKVTVYGCKNACKKYFIS